MPTPSIGGIALPEAYVVWINEFDHTRVDLNIRYTLGGIPKREVSTRQKGRSITVDCGWVTRETMLAIQDLHEDPYGVFPLVLPSGQSFSVMFQRPPVKARPVIDYTIHENSDFIELTLNLLEI